MIMKYFVVFAFLICSSIMLGQEWQVSYSEALSCAEHQNKPIILVFSGSDWCAPCIKLDKEIWQSTEFKSYAKENYILYKADFPRKKSNKLDQRLETQNKALAESFNPKGHFPLVVVLSKSEKVLGQTAYKKIIPTEYISHLNSFLK